MVSLCFPSPDHHTQQVDSVLNKWFDLHHCNDVRQKIFSCKQYSVQHLERPAETEYEETRKHDASTIDGGVSLLWGVEEWLRLQTKLRVRELRISYL